VTDRPTPIPCADPLRAIPESAGERGFAIDAALETLRDEERRLERMGFEWPLARCRQQRRYWEFVGALHAMTEREATDRWER